MTLEAALPSTAPADPVGPAVPVPVPPGVTVVDGSDPPLPLAPLDPVEIAPVPGVGRLLRMARATLGLLAHPYPHRVPRPPLTREEQLAFAENERARLERERQAYRTMALGGPMR